MWIEKSRNKTDVNFLCSHLYPVVLVLWLHAQINAHLAYLNNTRVKIRRHLIVWYPPLLTVDLATEVSFFMPHLPWLLSHNVLSGYHPFRGQNLILFLFWLDRRCKTCWYTRKDNTEGEQCITQGGSLSWQPNISKFPH